MNFGTTFICAVILVSVNALDNIDAKISVFRSVYKEILSPSSEMD